MTPTRRPAILAAATLTLAALPGQGADEVKPERAPAAILAELQAICTAARPPHANSIRLPGLQLGRATRDTATPYIALAQPPRCGLGADGRARLERRAASARAMRIARHYGVHLARGVLAGDSPEVRLPLADAARRIGFAFRTSERETPEHGLTVAGAAARLRGQGWHIHHVDLELFRSHQHETLSPQLAYAVSVIAFLESHGRKLGFDLTPFVGPAPQELALPKAEGRTLVGGADLHHDERQLFFTVARRGSLRLRMKGLRGVKAKGPALVVLGHYWTPPYGARGYDFSGPAPEFFLTQGRLRVSSSRGVFILPAAFAPTAPFEIRGRLPAGQYTFGGSLLVRPSQAK